MLLKKGSFFGIPDFRKMWMPVVDKYGDLGYAFVDVNPQPTFHDDAEPPSVDLVYDIAKGDKFSSDP